MTSKAQRATAAAIETEIFANLFRSIVNEMGWIIQRSAHTTFVKETMDFGTALVTPEGEQFAVNDSTGVNALIGTPMAPGIEAFTDWAPGDVAITNDPYTTAGMVTHLNDVFFLKPLFVDGEILCFVWAFIHCSDIGGKVPGSIDGTNREVFQEGLRIKSTKLYKAGVLNQDMVDVITSNCRSPEMNWGDLGAAISGLNRGEERLRQLIARYDRETVRGGMYRMLDRSEALTRAVLKEIPAGSYEFVEYLEDSYVSAVPIRAMLRLTSRGDGSVELDFTGSDPQVASAINMPAGDQKHHPMLSVAIMNLVVTLSEAPIFNAGILRCIDLVLPKHSFVNASFPAACGMRVLTTLRVHDMTLGALAAAIPGRIPAGGAGQLAIISVSTADFAGKTRVVAANAVAGGAGGGLGLDGLSGADYPTSALRNIPVEVLEAEAPVLAHRYTLLTDSEGAGRYRGGFGVEYAFEVTDDRATVVVRGKDRYLFSAWGVDGGKAAVPSFSRVLQADGTELDVGKQSVYQPQRGDLLIVGGGGGGGYGSPLERDPEQVHGDILDGLVSPERGREQYGVVLTDDGAIDRKATAALRADKRGQIQTAQQTEPDPIHPVEVEFGPGRSQWQADWEEAFAIIADWCRKFPPNGRRIAQERAYLSAVEKLSPAPTRGDVRNLLEQLEGEWA
ncbi:MAG: hydantoinase B/oxoprolinase family protein [Gammaproteobacteria bacterium]|nr:hydantoinase B/oxoprolinase family protein [Gammaproteobacteria bacterium]